MKALNITREEYDQIYAEEEEEVTYCLFRKKKYEQEVVKGTV